MTKSPLVSVIVPVYNAERYVERCIDSICRQSYESLQIIVVDDGSTDRSYQLLQALAERDSRILLVKQPNAGVSAARNRGLSLATGDYIGFVDSDDTISPDMYQALIERIVQDSSDIAECGYALVDEVGNSVLQRPLIGKLVVGVKNCCYDQLLMENSASTCWNKLYSLRIAKSAKFPILSHSEDYCYNVATHLLCKSRSTVSGCYYLQNIGNVMSVTRRPADSRKLDSVRGADMARQLLDEKLPQLSYLADTYIMNNVYWSYPAVSRGDAPDKREILRELRDWYRMALTRMKNSGHGAAPFSRLALAQNLFLLSPRLYFAAMRLRSFGSKPK